MQRPVRSFAAVTGQTRPIKVMINIGACLDIITGRYIIGSHGEHILNGGLANLTGIAGRGNSFKSTIMHYMMLSAQGRMYSSFCGTYDTEMNIQEWHLKEMALSVRRALDVPAVSEDDEQMSVLDSGEWVVTDKAQLSGNEWYDKFRDFMKNKKATLLKEWKVTTPFKDRDGSLLKIGLPTMNEIDSFSEFSTDAVETMQDNAQIGESGQNMVNMKLGNVKTQLLLDLPGQTVGSDNYVLNTVHIGQEYQLDPRSPPKKKLGGLAQGDKMKGVPEKYTFLMQNCWLNSSATPLINQGTKEPEFPRDDNDDRKGDTDLKVVTLKQLRGKSGPTDITVDIVVSQTLGVLPGLTEFYYIKERGRFGIEGSLQSYNLTLYPVVKMSRKTVRRSIDNDKKLRRAMNITAELCQIHEYWYHMTEDLLSPTELFEGVQKAGFDWDFLLEHTRGYWVLEEDPRPLGLFLSTMDLIRIARGLYVPYWWDAEKKEVKAEYKYQYLAGEPLPKHVKAYIESGSN